MMVYVPILLSLLSQFGLAAVQAAQTARYTIQKQYTKSNFFSEFDFINGTSPTHGPITYVPSAVANQNRLAGFVQDQIYLGIDYSTLSAGTPRMSTRLQSKQLYNGGLFVADIVHMPEGCGTWPALWSFAVNSDPNVEWPVNGEIDVLENVNSATNNRITLHTAEGCNVTSTGSASSSMLLETDCNADTGHEGCSMNTTAKFGRALNDAGGAVWTWEWTNESVSVWGFDNSSSIAAAIRSSVAQQEAPDMSSWGTPTAKFVSGADEGCDFPSHFQNHTIVINTEICGDWAGANTTWDPDPMCGAKAKTCVDYLANTPDALIDAYWLINSITVFTTDGTITNGTITNGTVS
jgi:hypothetical protein